MEVMMIEMKIEIFVSGAQCCVLAFSITDRASFDAVDRWREKVSKYHSLYFAHNQTPIWASFIQSGSAFAIIDRYQWAIIKILKKYM